MSVNNPDKIFFVGEAVVGNEAVDQLTKFNRSLKDFSGFSSAKARGIDGMILTKMDIIDDKVGHNIRTQGCWNTLLTLLLSFGRSVPH